MKVFDDLTDQEIYDLTTDQIDYYKKIACAEAGVPFAIPPIPDRPISPDMVPDAFYYRIKMGWGDYLGFATAEAAAAVADLINNGPRVVKESFAKGEVYILLADNKVGVETEEVYSEKKYKQIRDAAEEYAMAKTEYDKAVTANNKAVKAYDETTGWIRGRITQAAENIRQLICQQDAFREYVTLAKKDAAIAYKFFVKAYGKPNKEMRQFIKTEYAYSAQAKRTKK